MVDPKSVTSTVTSADIMGTVGWTVLETFLTISGGTTLQSIADTLASDFANGNVTVSPTGGVEASYPLPDATLSNFKVTGATIGIEYELGLSLIFSGNLTIDTGKIMGELTFAFYASFSSGGAVISGQLDGTYPLPVPNWSLTNPLLVLSISTDDGIVTPGVGGIANLDDSLQSSFMILILPPSSGDQSSAPSGLSSLSDLGSIDGVNDVFLLSVSTIDVTTILGAFGLSVPDAIKPLLNIVKITGCNSFTATDANLASELDSKDPSEQTAALTTIQQALVNAQATDPTLPEYLTLATDPTQVVILVLDKGNGWSITNLADQSQYSLQKNADGTIQVTPDAQIYCVQDDTSFAGNTFKAGNRVTGRVSILGFGGQGSVDLDTLAFNATLDPLAIKISGTEVFSITAADDPSKGASVAYQVPAITPANPTPDVGDLHIDFDAEVTLLDLSVHATVGIGAEGFAFSIGTSGVEVSGSASFLPPGVGATVSVDAGSVFIPPFGPTVHLGGLSAGLNVSTDSVTIEDFVFDVLGVTLTVPGFSVPAGGSLLSQLGDVPAQAASAVLNQFESFFDPAALAKAAAAYLTDLGYLIDDAANEIANALSEAGGDLASFGQAAAQYIESGWNSPWNPFGGFVVLAVSAGSSPPAAPQRLAAPLPDLQPIAVMISNGIQIPVQEVIGIVVKWRKATTALDVVQYFSAAGIAPGQLAGPLKQNGYAAGDIGAAIMTVYNLSAISVAPYLTDAGFKASEVAAFASSNGVTDRVPLAQLLVAGYVVDAAADCFRTYPYNLTLNGAETVSVVLSEAGYDVATQWPDPDTTYYIACAGGLANPGSRLLSINQSLAPFVPGQLVKVIEALGFVSQDDGSGAQLWQFTKLPDGVYQIYNPSINCTLYLGNAPVDVSWPQQFLSVHLPAPPDTHQTCDVFDHDDNSGRQQWTLTPTGDGSFDITIEKAGALSFPAYKYLSCSSDGTVVDLYDQDDESGRQQWRLLPSMSGIPARLSSPNGSSSYAQEAQYLVGAGYAVDAVADCFRTYPFNMVLNAAETASVLGEAGYKITTQWPEPGQAYFIVPAGGLANPSSRLLNVIDPNNALGFAPKDDGSGRQLWTFTQVADGVDGVYTISPLTSGWPNGGFLSCDPAQSVPVNVWSTVDTSGRQHWTLTPAGDGSFTITIETKSALDNYAYKYLSCKADGTVVDLWWQDGGGLQEWRLLPWPAADDGTQYFIQVQGGIPEGPGGPGTYLAPTQDGSNLLQFSNNPSPWIFQMVAKGVYRIKAAGLQRYLSCRYDSGQANIYYGDDDSGRQRWTLTPIGGGSFTMSIETPGALSNATNKYLSCGSGGTYFDLYDHDDGTGRQRWRVTLAAGS